MKMLMPFREILFLTISVGFLLQGCGSATSPHQKEYKKIWKEIVNSPEWEKSIAVSDSLEAAEGRAAYPRTRKDFKVAKADGTPVMDPAFVEKYHSWVSQAYFKIIQEASRADKHIEGSYLQMLAESEAGNTAVSEEELAMAKERYLTHRRMLDGLKSWRAFEKDGSDDLDFFNAEYVMEAYRMHKNGQSEDSIISFLMVKLADLYHLEETESRINED
ncbi:hypothetical protein [Zeaxanthinibacter enoshimensis]|uniref:hypothetical protein n=1 Tax=Zeaxanthinibacter enoshimensis TaxID=392009 RepID=UPI0035626DB8